LQNREGQPQQVVMTLPIIEGTDGVQKMSKSLGNHIGVKDAPKEMFGKIMSIPDSLIERYYRYLSALPKPDVEAAAAELKSGVNPRDIKARLGERMVELFHSAEAGRQAHTEFNEIFKNKGLPDEITEFEVAGGMDLVSLLVHCALAPSKSEAKRALEAGAVKIDQQKVSDAKLVLDLSNPVILQNGKRKFARVKLAS